MKLFDLTSAYQNLLDLAADGEDFEAALDELRGSIEEKAEGYAFVIKTLEAEAEAIGEEAKKLLAKAQHRTNAAKRLKDHLQAALVAAGIDKVKGKLYTVALQNSPPSVEVEDMELVPVRHLVYALAGLKHDQVPPELMEASVVSVNKKAIMDAYRSDGVAPGPGLTIKQSKHLRIR